MRSVLLEAPGRLVLQEVPEPTDVGPGEALVRVLRVGVCGSDLHAFNGRQAFMRYPIVLGHELAVEVLAVGPDAPGAPGVPEDATEAVVGASEVPVKATEAVVGDRCAVVPYLSCGTCQACRAGRTNCCEHLKLLGIHVDGGLRERFVLPRGALLVANDVDVDALALVEMLAVGAHASRRAAVAPDERVLVLGAGPIGLATMAFLAPGAAATWTFDLDARRAAFAADALGVHALTVDAAAAVPTPDELLAGVRRAFGGDLPDVVVDATGHRASMEGAPRLVAPGGRVVFVGHTPGELTFPNPLLHGREVQLIASRNATRGDVEAVVAALRSGEVDPVAWISARVDAAGLVDAIAGWAKPGSPITKAVVTWGDAPAGPGSLAPSGGEQAAA